MKAFSVRLSTLSVIKVSVLPSNFEVKLMKMHIILSPNLYPLEYQRNFSFWSVRGFGDVNRIRSVARMKS